jgi:hypothetical protein
MPAFSWHFFWAQCDFNEVIDGDSWEVVWRLNRRSARGITEPLQLSIEVHDWRQATGRMH